MVSFRAIVKVRPKLAKFQIFILSPISIFSDFRSVGYNETMIFAQNIVIILVINNTKWHDIFMGPWPIVDKNSFLTFRYYFLKQEVHTVLNIHTEYVQAVRFHDPTRIFEIHPSILVIFRKKSVQEMGLGLKLANIYQMKKEFKNFMVASWRQALNKDFVRILSSGFTSCSRKWYLNV